MDDPMLFWYCAAFFFLGGVAGTVLTALFISDRIQTRVREEDLRRRQRKLAENGRKYPAHQDALGPARVTRARTRKTNRKP